MTRRGRRRDARATVAILAAIVVAAALPVSADFAFKTFTNTNGLNLQAAANRTVDRLRLTPALQSVVGSAWREAILFKYEI